MAMVHGRYSAKLRSWGWTSRRVRPWAHVGAHGHQNLASLGCPPVTHLDPTLCIHEYFDGACQHHLGSGGCLLFHPDGGLLHAASIYYKAEAPTNNTAKGVAILDCLKLIDNVEW